MTVFEQLDYSADILNKNNLIGGKEIDSIRLVSLISALSDYFNINISFKDIDEKTFYNVSTIAALVGRLKTDGATKKK